LDFLGEIRDRWPGNTLGDTEGEDTEGEDTEGEDSEGTRETARMLET
jgi:hypothetical protein